jgi:RNA polymerase sigma factor FliA
MTPQERDELALVWRAAKAGDTRAVETLVVRYHWLPAKIARSKRVPPHFDRDDVVSWANAGLFDAVRKFAPDSGDGQLHEHFIGYATLRINGSILDGMKAPGQSWATREVWRKVRAMSAAEETLGQSLGRPATRAEVAQHMGVTQGDLPVLQQQVVLDSPTDGRYESHAPDILPEVITTEASAEIADIAARLAVKLTEMPQEDQDLAARLFLHGQDVRDVVDATGAPLARVRRQRADMLLRLRDLLQRS